ncbi:NUDIX domain-containing protein [Streptomyces sp. NPDC058642]|uniref:NUDIX domain-containing protein n=1 Tax=Streptomyces sp. NPDC058642 TaxID=3346572 RepID=UPI00364DB44D
MLNFVGGMVMDTHDRVLMVRRADHVDHMAGLWSLPGGALRPGESDHEAVVRKVLGETGLEVVVESPFGTVNRKGLRATAYRARAVGGQVQQGIDKGIVECRFFALDEVPERTVLEAGMALAYHRLKNSAKLGVSEYSAIVDNLFSNLFYSYLDPALETLDIENLSDFSWLIRSTPLRKFKSVIPFLMSDRSDRAREFALVGEIYIALCTMIDDIGDSRDERYGFPTAHRHFGRPYVIALISGAVESLRKDLAKRYGDAYAETMSDALLTFSRAQAKRFAGDHLDIPSYFDNCVKRNNIMGVAWAAGLRETGQDFMADFLYAMHRAVIPSSQMVNDYYDIARKEFRDFRAGVHSYCTLKLAAEYPDRKELEDLLAHRTEPTAERRYHELLAEYDIVEKVRRDICAALAELDGTIENAPLSDAQRTVLTCWNDIPRMNGFDAGDFTDDFTDRALRFVDSLDQLCETLS